jgi:hypothetical protein
VSPLQRDPHVQGLLANGHVPPRDIMARPRLRVDLPARMRNGSPPGRPALSAWDGPVGLSRYQACPEWLV